jgi:flavodoxin I
MKKTCILYGSSTGNTESIANILADKLGADKFDVSTAPIDAIKSCDNIIMGASTWGIGDLQDDWETFLPMISDLDLSGKTIAFYGLGDSSSYPDSFVDAMGIIFNAIKDKGCKFVGAVGSDGYTFDESQAIIDGKFIGLPLDEDNESSLTKSRINAWIEEIKPHF